MLIPTLVFAYTGLFIADATCTESGDILDFTCLEHIVTGFLLGGLVGLAVGVILARWAWRKLKRRWLAKHA